MREVKDGKLRSYFGCLIDEETLELFLLKDLVERHLVNSCQQSAARKKCRKLKMPL